jgi:hypothetical protein
VSRGHLCTIYSGSIRFYVTVHLFSAYCVVATESAGRQLPVGFIERVKEDFAKKYSSGKARTAAANGLKREYGYFP